MTSPDRMCASSGLSPELEASINATQLLQDWDMEAESTDYGPAEWIPSHNTNYTVNERAKIDRIIVHTTQGNPRGDLAQQALNWTQTPNSKASWHYLVSGRGGVFQSVRERDTGWHAGNWFFNQRSIGIEHAAMANEVKWLTAAMYDASARLTAYLCKRYGIPVDRTHIIEHKEVPHPNNHTDPGIAWDWNKYLALVRKYAGVAAPPPPPPNQGGTLWRVEVPHQRQGIYKVHANALGVVENLKKLGVEAGIVSEQSVHKVWIPVQRQGSYKVWANADGVVKKLTLIGVKSSIVAFKLGTAPAPKPPAEGKQIFKQTTLVPPGFREVPPRAGDYVARHPTRFTFRADLHPLLYRIYKRWPQVFMNTYHDHPEGYWRTVDSFDVWGGRGRGWPVGFGPGQEIMDYVWYDPDPPLIDWCIWRRRIWSRATGVWAPWGRNEFEWHDDHDHFTMLRV